MNVFTKSTLRVFVFFFVLSVAVSTASYFVTGDANPFATGTAEACCGDDSDGGDSGDTYVPPVCYYLRADGQSGTYTLPYGGGDVTLSWSGSYASQTKLSPLGITVPEDGSKIVSVTNDTTYRITHYNSDGADSCTVRVLVESQPNPSCDFLKVSTNTLPYGGGDVTLDWETTNADIVTINGIGAVDSDGSKTVTVTEETVFTVTAENTSGVDSCTETVTVAPPKVPTCDLFEASPSVFENGTGGALTLTWETTNVTSISIDNNVGTFTQEDGSTVVEIAIDPVMKPTTVTYTLTADGIDDQVVCSTDVLINPKPLTCAENVSFTADRTSLPVGGGNVALTWTATGVDTISIDNGILSETPVLSGNDTASVADDVIYTLTAKRGDESVQCPLAISVADPEPEPVTCAANVALTASPTNLPVGGGEVTLTWSTTDIKSVKLDGVTQSLSGSATTTVTEGTTFNLEVVGDDTTTGNTVICPVSVTVADPTPLSCAANVSFTVNDSSVREGSNVTLTWSTTGVTEVSISPNIGSTTLSGSQVVRIDNDITYTLTATNGDQTINCPLNVNAESGGGGGGGSSSPRCDFLVSDDKIRAGEEVTLSWETSRGRDLTIYEGDEDGEKIFETSDDDVVDEGSIKVRPTKDTTYTLVVERGSRNRDCTVDVDVEDRVVITSTRTQGQVAGISLTAVPYTGFEAGPMLTLLFYSILAIWGLFVAYTLVIREDRLFGFSLAGAFTENRIISDDVVTEDEMETGESKAAEYVASVTAPTQTRASVATPVAPSIPVNLPTGVPPVIGYASIQTEAPVVEDVVDELKDIEDRAHDQRVLLSSDAMRHLLTVCPAGMSRLAYLDEVIAEAKISFPSEDGWVVLNLDRMVEVCDKRKTATPAVSAVIRKDISAPETKVATVPTGSGSLAESIVTGNIAAAYQMIGSRPMIALADAAADLDSVYRARKGEAAVMSDMLKAETADIPTEKIEGAINALTSAIDGTYTDEAAAVKMAIMKAVKALA